MVPKKLHDVIVPVSEDGVSLRWQAAVPLATNPILLLEVIQLALIGAAVVLAVLCVGVRLMSEALTLEDVLTSLWMACLVFLAVLAGFVAVATFFFGNKYFAVYHADSSGIYYEGSRGQDGRSGFFFYMRTMPVISVVKIAGTSGRYLPWEKADRFQDIPSMRVIVIRRGFWHLLRLYTPDAITHKQVTHYLEQRLKKI